jgi:hypothetical protein
MRYYGHRSLGTKRQFFRARRRECRKMLHLLNGDGHGIDGLLCGSEMIPGLYWSEDINVIEAALKRIYKTLMRVR